MKNWSILNDVHIGAIRALGTTPVTAMLLRKRLLNKFGELLSKIDTNLLINGDLFDSAAPPLNDLLATYGLLTQWLQDNPQCKLAVSDGNHDLAKNSTVLSGFQLLAALLQSYAPERVQHVSGGAQMIDDNICVLPHVVNQDLLNLELEKIEPVTYLCVHANYDNNFAAESDHSLNISRLQAEKLPVEHIIFGHEHQAKRALNDKVIIAGNQISSSVADCLGNSEKSYLCIDSVGLSIEPVCMISDEYAEQDWRDLQDTKEFIRVVGTATAAEAADVITAIAKFRSKASALVITNAVQIEGQNDATDLALTHEKISAFNVMQALLELLTPEEGQKILKLQESTND